MSLDIQPIINVADIPLNALSHGQRFAVQTGEIGAALGLSTLGCMLHVVPPGKTAFPFHRHHGCDEMFVILSGTGEYRIGEARLPVRAGDCLGAPAGGEAHQIINTGPEELRYLGLSNVPAADLVEYPDSGKIGVGVGAKGVHYESATFKKRGRLMPAEYWDGEDWRMSLKDALTAERNRKREAEEAERRPHEVAYGQLKTLFHQIMADQELRDSIHGEVELNGGELQIDPGPILIRASVDHAGDFHLSYEIKSAYDPVIRTVEVKTIPDIENAVARLLVEYEDVG